MSSSWVLFHLRKKNFVLIFLIKPNLKKVPKVLIYKKILNFFLKQEFFSPNKKIYWNLELTFRLHYQVCFRFFVFWTWNFFNKSEFRCSEPLFNLFQNRIDYNWFLFYLFKKLKLSNSSKKWFKSLQKNIILCKTWKIWSFYFNSEKS